MTLPMRPPPSEDHDQLNVLVPGIMGIGFLISLFMLMFDAFEKVLPMVGRRRTAELARLSAGRSNDLQSIWDGSPPEVGVVHRAPRGRIASLMLAAGAFLAAYFALHVGFDVAADTGTDRQAWGATFGVLVAIALIVPGLLWLGVAISGARTPGWLRWFHQFWPLGALPDLTPETRSD